MDVKPGGARVSVDLIHEYIEHFGVGVVPTDGNQYSAVATVGTTGVAVFDKTIDPGAELYNKEIEVFLEQKFTNLNGSFLGTISYYWQMQSVSKIPSAGHLVAFTGTLINITGGTYTKVVGTLLSSEDKFEGYIPVGSIPYSPVRLVLTAVGDRASLVGGQVSNDSYIRLVGIAIPHT